MLIIIESPGKRVAIAKYTGAKVMASFGHIKDLPEKTLGVDLNTFDPVFDAINDKQKDIIKALRSAAKGEDVYIATDKDREGDAIAVFIYQEIKSLARNIYRAKFGEITKEAVNKGISEAIDFKNINWGAFNSFLGRRVGDRIVGYLLSPVAHNALNWDKKDYVSVGRVQTIAQKIIVDREREIKNFIPTTSYYIQGLGNKQNFNFKLKQNFENIKDKNEANSLLDKVLNSSTGVVKDIKQEEVKGKQKAPYVTASLLADASSKLGLNAEQTMFILQKLYEGFGAGGFITYMRTDSAILSDEYMDKIGDFLSSSNMKDQYNGKVKHKSKHSQAEAHEAIRPSMGPKEALEKYDEIKGLFKEFGDNTAKKAADLFQMITERTIQSQMAVPTYSKTTIIIDVNGIDFFVAGRILTKKGYLALKDDDEEDETKDKEDSQSLPNFEVGEKINVSDFELKDSITEAPKRFTEASLIKELEKKEIGRPSTYVSTLKTLTSKNFAKIEEKRLVPTQKAFAVVEFLEKNHPYIVDYHFTANMEEFLDKVEDNGFDWKDFIKDLYGKMGDVTVKRNSTPTQKMVEMAKTIASRNNIELNEEILLSFEKTKQFLEENISSTPSEAQVNFAKSLANQLNISIDMGTLEDKSKLKKWIDENLKKANSQKTLSEKQISIIERNAPESIKKLIGKNTDEANKKLKDWLDSYFKKKN